MRKFATKVASRQNIVDYPPRTQIMNRVKIVINMLNWESNYTLCKIAIWVKHFTMCKIAHSVKDYTQRTFFHVTCGKFYTWLKTFTQPAIVMVVTNIRCDNSLHTIQRLTRYPIINAWVTRPKRAPEGREGPSQSEITQTMDSIAWNCCAVFAIYLRDMDILVSNELIKKHYSFLNY